MKIFILSAFAVLSLSSAFAASNAYDQGMLDCLDYYHSPKSQKEIMVCHRDVLETLNQSKDFQDAFLDCVDYYHPRITFQKEVSCAKEASAL